MYIRVPAPQVVKIWEVIKWAIAKVYRIEKEQAGEIFINVLHKLLNDKYQCYVHLSDDEQRTIKAMVFTEICVNKISGKKMLAIPCLYSFSYHSMEEWGGFFQLIIDFANQQNAWPIECQSGNDRVWEIVKYLGFEEISRNFVLNKGEK